MAGEGFMQHAINSLRNNRGLLRRNSYFKKDKSFFIRRKEYLKATKGKIKSKKLSKHELLLIRNKIISNRRKENIKLFIILSLITTLVTWFAIHQYNISKSAREQQIEAFEQKKHVEDTNQFHYFISDGDKWIEKRHWNNAIFRYKQAIEIFPKDYVGNYRLSLAYSYKCKFKNKDCDLGEKLTERMLTFFPDNGDLLKLQHVFLSQKDKN
ncbi:MAG: hypothetical protein COA67_02885 [Lutibacter sp.]|nr:MAG: hypothetical protein COA67_02885 [Lutibacter sp.]